MANLHYYLGPWQLRSSADDQEYWAPPDAAVGSVDLRSLPGVAGGQYGFFASTGPLASEYVMLDSGDLREIHSTGALQDAWQSLIGYRPAGEKLVDLLWDQLTVGADPAGEDFAPPLMPTSRGRLELQLGGHSLVKSKRFRLDLPEAAPVIDALRRAYRRTREQSERGQSRPGQHLRLLDYWGKQFRIKDPHNVFIPRDLPREPPRKHETEYADDFNRANQAGLGTSSSGAVWNQLTNTEIDVAGNQAVYDNTTNQDLARLEGDLSSANQLVWVTLVSLVRVDTGINVSLNARWDSTLTQNHYEFNLAKPGFSPGGLRRIYANVSGTLTEVATVTENVNDGERMRGVADGSTLKMYVDSTLKLSATNTLIGSGLRSGLRINTGSTNNSAAVDEFRVKDLPPAAAAALGLLASGNYGGIG